MVRMQISRRKTNSNSTTNWYRCGRSKFSHGRASRVIGFPLKNGTVPVANEKDKLNNRSKSAGTFGLIGRITRTTAVRMGRFNKIVSGFMDIFVWWLDFYGATQDDSTLFVLPLI